VVPTARAGGCLACRLLDGPCLDVRGRVGRPCTQPWAAGQRAPAAVTAQGWVACSLPGAGWGVGVSGREELPRVRVEFVTMGGPEGQALEERQLAVIKEILAWLHQHPASISQHDQKAA
jgi:hypothetical protein